MSGLDDATIDLIRRAVAEDVGSGDVTSEACVPGNARGAGRIVARAEGVVSGLAVAAGTFLEVDASLLVETAVRDGRRVTEGQELLRVSGAVRSILIAERVALNFLTHLSGVATMTSRFVAAADGRIKILDTRKTIPGLRALEKKAVVDGGGANHRFGLDDGIMIKDNHVAAAGGWEEALRRVRERRPRGKVILEVADVETARRAAAAGVEHLLLDNMSLEEIRDVVGVVGASPGPRPFLEVSGGVALAAVAGIAATGVDAVSVGSLTHSAPALDLALDMDPS